MATILLVEDEKMNRDMLARRLGRKGFDVLLAVDGMEGVETAKRKQPHLILMDMSLPELDGLATTTILKETPETATIPVIALTAHNSTSYRDRAISAGCDDFDTKPVDIERLLEKINRLISQ